MSRVQCRARGRHCPHCCGYNVRLSHLRGWEFLVVFLPVRPYRCRDCDLRFWRPGWGLKPVPG